MFTALELNSPCLGERFYYPDFLEPTDYYQPRAMSNADSISMYEPATISWDWKNPVELLTEFSRHPQLSSSVDDEYDKLLEPFDAPNYVPFLDLSRIVPKSELDSEETPPAPDPPPRKTSMYGKGNNPFGSRGCESCAPCRRRKGRV